MEEEQKEGYELYRTSKKVKARTRKKESKSLQEAKKRKYIGIEKLHGEPAHYCI